MHGPRCRRQPRGQPLPRARPERQPLRRRDRRGSGQHCGAAVGRVIRQCDNGHPPVRVPSGSPCAACERRRPSRQARGYGANHQRARATIAAMLPAPRFYCRTVIGQGEPFVAAHVVDGDPAAGWAAADAACNEGAKVRRGWGSTSAAEDPASTRARQSEARPGFSLSSARQPRPQTEKASITRAGRAWLEAHPTTVSEAVGGADGLVARARPALRGPRRGAAGADARARHAVPPKR